MRILISYHSDYGNTERMAEAIAAGAKVGAPNASIIRKRATETTNQDLLAADVIVFGTPVHMGAMAWQMKKLIDDAYKFWMSGELEGKVGGVFVSGGGFGGAGGGVELTMASLYSNFLEHGMVVVGFPKSLPGYADGGLQWGPYGRSGRHDGMPDQVSDAALTACRSYGVHLAETSAKLLGH